MKAIVSPEAVGDIQEIIDHIGKDNPGAAERLLAEIATAIERLSDMPGMGHVRPDLTSRSIRFWSVRRVYMIAYRELTDAIEIVRVLHGSRDVASLLR